MTKPTLVTFLWAGWRPVYDYRHVNTLARMLQANSPGFRLVCITDRPEGICECETFPLWPSPVVTRPGERNCFVRLKLFEEATCQALGGWVCNVDLDCVIFRDLSPLFDPPLKFRALRGILVPINGSLWAVQAEAHPEVWHDFDPVRSRQAIAAARHNGRPLVGSDQAWMSLKIKQPHTWGVADGVQQYSHYQPKWPTRILFFAGRVKPWDSESRTKCSEAYQTYREFFR